MNYDTLKQYKEEIFTLRGKIGRIERKLVDCSSALSDMPKSITILNKIESLTVEKLQLKEELKKTEQLYDDAILSIPTERKEGQGILMKLDGDSWIRIATVILHDPSEHKNFMRKCTRFKW